MPGRYRHRYRSFTALKEGIRKDILSKSIQAAQREAENKKHKYLAVWPIGEDPISKKFQELEEQIVKPGNNHGCLTCLQLALSQLKQSLMDEIATASENGTNYSDGYKAAYTLNLLDDLHNALRCMETPTRKSYNKAKTHLDAFGAKALNVPYNAETKVALMKTNTTVFATLWTVGLILFGGIMLSLPPVGLFFYSLAVIAGASYFARQEYRYNLKPIEPIIKMDSAVRRVIKVKSNPKAVICQSQQTAVPGLPPGFGL